MNPGIASAAIARPYVLMVKNRLVKISQQCLPGGFSWTQVQIVIFSSERKERNPTMFRTL